jgi:hypothetical protein
VFLFPENWLEPELRDDKSPFFRELESELLQSDITDDAAATALLHYLEKLDEVAKLEICGMYYDENDEERSDDDVIHVIARTSGTRRNYYYRRLEGSTWMPWEKMDLNIEDNPVLPVVWKGRLLLFWVSVLQEASQPAPASGTPLDLTTVSPANLRNVGGATKVRVKATLYWSEHYNGKWQPPRTSDLSEPMELGEFDPNTFDRSKLTLASSFGDDRRLGDAAILYIDVGYQVLEPGAPFYTPHQLFSDHFKFFNTHGLPIRRREELLEELKVQAYTTSVTLGRLIKKENGNLVIDNFDVDLIQNTEDLLFSQSVLGGAAFPRVIEPRHYYKDVVRYQTSSSSLVDYIIFPYIRDLFGAPFFYQDRRHVFFVRPSRTGSFIGYLDDIVLTHYGTGQG